MVLVHMRGLLLLGILVAWNISAASREDTEFFETRIRPVLAQECYECHNSKGKAKGGLILDHRAGLLAGGDLGPAVIPGQPDKSPLIQAIRHDDEDLKMPRAGAKLDDPIVRDFVKWVKMGAPDPRDNPPSANELAQDTDWPAVMHRRKAWWSFQPIGNPLIPTTRGGKHSIDRFVMSGLERAGLKSSKPADAHTLLRRITFALTGLPPTVMQIDNFVAAYGKSAEQAVTALVDGLLASPRFGERWARHWMDWIRYAESHGSEGDPRIENAHLYRDYLIRALNSDIPYDQLLREHVAGDLLPKPRLNTKLEINESLIGTAHWRMVFHGFAPTDALDEKVRFTDDQINVFSKAFLGLTVSCARCHNHKFDAISQADYYALFGILGSTRPGRTAIDLPAKQSHNLRKLAEVKDMIGGTLADEWTRAADGIPAQLLKNETLWKKAKLATSLLHPWYLMKRDVKTPARFGKSWEVRLREWQNYRRSIAEFQQGKFNYRSDLAVPSDADQWFREGLGLARQPSSAGAFAIAPGGEQALVGIYPAGVYSHLYSQKHAARIASPDFRLNGKNELWLRIIGGGSAMSRYVVQNYPRRGTVFPVTELKDNQAGVWRWQKYDVAYWDGDDVHIELTSALDAPLLTKSNLRSWFGIREAVLIPSGDPAPVESREFLAPVMAAAKASPPQSFEDLAQLYAEVAKSSLADWKARKLNDGGALFLHQCLQEGLLPNKVDQLKSAAPLIAQYRELEEGVPVPTRIPTLSEWTAKDQPLLERGDHNKPLEPVSRRFLEAVDDRPYRSRESGRIELANDLLRDDNPFTRRVIVNRVWHHLFGRGIVATPDNFGRMGEKPSHPELLDHLAQRFVSEQDWSLKKLIRFIVTSRTWQQDSTPSAAAKVKDPENALLSHFNVQRLDAESIRDSLLAAAGNLDLKLYGPAVSGTANRRSVYVRVIRNQLDPFLAAFDAPVPFATKGRRDVTTVPAQSLALMNDPFVLSVASRAGSRAAAISGHDQERLRAMWTEMLGRKPSPSELRLTQELLDGLKSRYSEQAGEKERLASQLRTLEQEAEQIMGTVRARLLARQSDITGTRSATNLNPIARWDFEEDLQDSIGNLHGQAHEGARLEGGALIVDGRGWVFTKPLGKGLRAKTLEARVILGGLNQKGGGVMTVQTLNGVTFDAIVYGEQRPQQWLAGSNNHRRTQSFDGSVEREALNAPVHLMFVYETTGTIRAYRDGKGYGKPYKTDLQSFNKGDTHVAFGIRHGTRGSGNRMLKGKILDAALYDRALTAEEAQAAASGESNFVSNRQVFQALSAPEKAKVPAIDAGISKLRKQISEQGRPVNESQAWADVALAIFNFKEFIYVR
jgi:hypothetical protein